MSAEVATTYVRHAFAQMLAVAARVGDPLVNEKPVGAATNSIAALVVHCCGVTERWLGHVALGRASTRDRDAEFRAVATVAELRELVARTTAQAEDDLRAIAAGDAVAGSPARSDLHGGGTDDSVVLHVLEELYQHLGHMEITADVLGAR